MLSKDGIIKLLSEHNQEDAAKFASYCIRLQQQKEKDGTPKNPWMQTKKDEEMAELFKRVDRDGLVFDGESVTLQNTGISYSYIAYKNKMLLTYPESIVDVALVYNGDTFEVSKDSGAVTYKHSIKDPFNQKDAEVIGGYCVIKNKRGEFLTLLSREDLDKHRKVAKTDYIWKSWFKEMALKTVIKKACKQHFADIYADIEANDNENYDLEIPVGLEITDKLAIDDIKTLDELRSFYAANKGKGKDFDKYIQIKKDQLTKK